MEAVLWKPGSIAFDKEGALYIVEDDDRDVRIAKIIRSLLSYVVMEPAEPYSG